MQILVFIMTLLLSSTRSSQSSLKSESLFRNPRLSLRLSNAIKFDDSFPTKPGNIPPLWRCGDFHFLSQSPISCTVICTGGASCSLNSCRELVRSTKTLLAIWLTLNTHPRTYTSSHFESWERDGELTLCLFCTVSYLNVSFSRDC